MRGIMLAGGASLLGGGAYLGGAFEQGDYYPMAPEAVEARLATVQFGPELGLRKTDKVTLALRSRGPSLLRWDLMFENTRIADVRAYLAPDAPGTRVRVEFAFRERSAFMGLDKDPLINDLAAIAMEEKIDSTLDGRAFNETFVQARMAAAMAADPQAILRIEETIEKEAGRNMARAVDDPDDRGTTVTPTASAKPLPPVDFNETHADGGWGNPGG